METTRKIIRIVAAVLVIYLLLPWIGGVLEVLSYILLSLLHA